MKQSNIESVTNRGMPRSLGLLLDPGRADIRQPLRHRAADWAAAWFAERPDAFILMACDGHARNADQAHRRLRLRRLKAAMVRHGVPGERIRFTTEPVNTPREALADERGMALCRVMVPEDIETSGVRSIVQVLND